MQAAEFVENAMGKLLASDEQDWSLDPTGNWSGFVTKAAGATTLDQSRASNRVNQITSISETAGTSWVDPAYDAAGNMTTMPQPPGPDQAFESTYAAPQAMDQSEVRPPRFSPVSGHAAPEIRFINVSRRARPTMWA